MIVSRWYPPPADSPLFGFKDLAQQKRIGSRVPIVGLNGHAIGTEQIDRFGDLVGDLGLDAMRSANGQARAAFRRAAASLSEIARRKSSLRIIAVSADQSTMFVAKLIGDLAFYSRRGVPLVSVETSDVYWDRLTWDHAAKYAGGWDPLRHAADRAGVHAGKEDRGLRGAAGGAGEAGRYVAGGRAAVLPGDSARVAIVLNAEVGLAAATHRSSDTGSRADRRGVHRRPGARRAGCAAGLRAARPDRGGADPRSPRGGDVAHGKPAPVHVGRRRHRRHRRPVHEERIAVARPRRPSGGCVGRGDPSA